MNQTDARNFLLAINAVVGYVPPMLMAGVTNSPVARLIEQIANSPEQPQGEQTPQERPKPHAVS
jgi:hypothetical protein